MTAREAMAYGRPVVATRVGGLADLGAGAVLVDRVGLRDAVRALLGDAELRRQRGAARARACACTALHRRGGAGARRRLRDRRMRVGVSMLTLVPGEMGGSETYARALCRALGARPDLDAVAFVNSAAPDAGEGLPTEVVSEYPAARTAPTKVLGLATSLLRRRKLAARFGDLDVVHYPFTIPVPTTDVPSVVTLHDLQHIDLPGMFSRSTRAFRRVAYDRAARRARVVIVPSEFVRDRAVAALGLDPARVCVVPHGLDHDVFSPADIPRESFILYPARVWPHKNHARLIAASRSSGATARISSSCSPAEAPRHSPELRACAHAASCRKPSSSICTAARRRRLPEPLRGLGAPPLEAMACGTPVAASNAGSLPEVCGDAAVLFDPYDEAAIAGGVRQALEQSKQLTVLRARADDTCSRGPRLPRNTNGHTAWPQGFERLATPRVSAGAGAMVGGAMQSPTSDASTDPLTLEQPSLAGLPNGYPVIVIEPRQPWSLGLRSLWSHRELTYYLVWRDVKLRYKQTFFGAGWALIQPILLMGVFGLFFGRLAGLPVERRALLGSSCWRRWCRGRSSRAHLLRRPEASLLQVRWCRRCTSPG